MTHHLPRICQCLNLPMYVYVSISIIRYIKFLVQYFGHAKKGKFETVKIQGCTHQEIKCENHCNQCKEIQSRQKYAEGFLF